MSDQPILTSRLHAWREDSRRRPSPLARERARAAMHSALALGRRAPHAGLFAAYRLRPRRLLVAGSATMLAALGAVVVLGWNAPAGSPLSGLRSARRSVQLALPGANTAALHLQFAEEDLADASAGADRGSSLADASSQLKAASAVLPSDHGSTLWGRYEDDRSDLDDQERGDAVANPTPARTPGAGTAPAAGTGEARPSHSSTPSTVPPPSESGDHEPSPGSGGDDSAPPSGSGDDGSAPPSGSGGDD